MPEPKVTADISDRRLVGQKVRVELEGVDGTDFSAIRIRGWVTQQYVDAEQDTVLRVVVSDPIVFT
jgi:hypothetical protein